MANQVVRTAAEPALLLRERLELAALWALPAGGLRLRPRALPQACTLRQGAAGETGEAPAAALGEGGSRPSLRWDPNFGPSTVCALGSRAGPSGRGDRTAEGAGTAGRESVQAADACRW